ncbi:MAG: hypothetical protein K940chlam9_00677 [Chlamydiae bacterium]|nr:hypothetical protein [Chlamydiota bacterium]
MQTIQKTAVFSQIKFHLLGLFFLAVTPVWADSNASYPPNPYETQGGKKAPTFSDANAQAIYWLNLIDQQQYSATWLEAGGLLRDAVTQSQWAAGIGAVRTPLGTRRSRKVASHSYATELPFGTKGNFIIIEYDTQYAKLTQGVERITLMTEGPYAQWKVVAYDIQRRS